jgi:putative ABC transport system ATP-binding protein
LGKGDTNINKNSLSEGGLPVVEVSNVKKDYVPGSLEIPVLSGVNLKIERGEFLDIIGPSGSGKSTLANLRYYLDMPDEGQALLMGKDLNRISDEEFAHFRGLEIGFVFQTFNPAPRLTALENVLLPTFVNSRTSIDPKRRARELLEIMGLHDRMHHMPGELSGGQSERVAIIRALVNNPAILLADELVGNLDSRTGTGILSIFMDLNTEGRTVIVVTYNPKIMKYSGRFILVKDQIIEYN